MDNKNTEKGDNPFEDLNNYFAHKDLKAWRAGHLERERSFASRLAQWVDAHANAMAKDAAKEISKDLRYVTQPEFEAAMAKSLAWAKGVLGDEPFHLAVTWKKSSAWLGWEALNTLGRNRCDGVLYVESSGDRVVNVEVAGQATTVHNVVYVDDAAHSGAQLIGVIRGLLRGLLLGSFGMDEMHVPDRVKLIIVVPFVSEHAWERIFQRILAPTANVPLPELGLQKKCVTSEGARCSACLYFSPVETKNILRPTSRKIKQLTGVAASQTATVFNHKIPNAVSFPQWLREGRLLNNGGLRVSWNDSKKMPFLPQENRKPY